MAIVLLWESAAALWDSSSSLSRDRKGGRHFLLQFRSEFPLDPVEIRVSYQFQSINWTQILLKTRVSTGLRFSTRVLTKSTGHQKFHFATSSDHHRGGRGKVDEEERQKRREVLSWRERKLRC